VPDPPEIAPQAHHRYITLSDWEGQGERSPSRLILGGSLVGGPVIGAAAGMFDLRGLCHGTGPAAAVTALAEADAPRWAAAPF
jgi:hypothetical protein